MRSDSFGELNDSNSDTHLEEDVTNAQPIVITEPQLEVIPGADKQSPTDSESYAEQSTPSDVDSKSNSSSMGDN